MALFALGRICETAIMWRVVRNCRARTALESTPRARIRQAASGSGNREFVTRLKTIKGFARLDVCAHSSMEKMAGIPEQLSFATRHS